jgi:hypothetical protein
LIRNADGSFTCNVTRRYCNRIEKHALQHSLPVDRSHYLAQRSLQNVGWLNIDAIYTRFVVLFVRNVAKRYRSMILGRTLTSVAKEIRENNGPHRRVNDERHPSAASSSR